MKRAANAEVALEDFQVLMQIGKGTFGKVYLAELRNNPKKFAIKVIRKDKLIQQKSVTSTVLEKDILLNADHPFLCGMEYLFQSETRLFFVLPFIEGGVMEKIIQKRGYFPESTVKFYAAQLVMGIGKLHQMGIIHRDVKLENVMLDEHGYIKIIDFGLAKTQ